VILLILITYQFPPFACAFFIQIKLTEHISVYSLYSQYIFKLIITYPQNSPKATQLYNQCMFML